MKTIKIKHKKMSAVIELTEDELKVLWHRLNLSDWGFKSAYKDSGSSELGSYKKLNANSSDLWDDINALLKNKE